MKICGVGLTVILNLAVALSLFVYAQSEMPLRSLFVYNPELGYGVIVAAAIGIGWSVVYTAMNLRTRRAKKGFRAAENLQKRIRQVRAGERKI